MDQQDKQNNSKPKKHGNKPHYPKKSRQNNDQSNPNQQQQQMSDPNNQQNEQQMQQQNGLNDQQQDINQNEQQHQKDNKKKKFIQQQNYQKQYGKDKKKPDQQQRFDNKNDKQINDQFYNCKQANTIHQMIHQLNKGNNKDKQLSQIFSHIIEKGAKDKKYDEEVTIILGNTGCGKTAFSAYMSDINLCVKKDKHGDSYIDYVDKSKELGNIGLSNIESETLRPNKFTSKNNQVFWDCPGFNDSRGEQFDVINSFYMNQIVSKNKTIRFILVLNGPSFQTHGFEDKGKPFKLSFDVILKIAQGSKLNLSNNLMIVFTKTEYPKEFYQKKLIDLLNQLQNNQQFCEDKFYKHGVVKDLLNQLKKSQIEVFPNQEPQEEYSLFEKSHKQSISQALDKVQYYTNKDIEIPNTVKSLQIVKLLWYYSREQLSNNLEFIFKKISSHFQNLSQDQLKSVKEIIIQQQTVLQKKKFKSNNQLLKQINNQLIFPLKSMIWKAIDEEEQIQIQKSITVIFLLVKDVYDNILSKTEFDQKDLNFFGILGKYEIEKGLFVLQQQLQILISKLSNQQNQNFNIQQQIEEIQQNQNINFQQQNQDLNIQKPNQNNDLNQQYEELLKKLQKQQEENLKNLRKQEQELQDRLKKQKEEFQASRFQTRSQQFQSVEDSFQKQEAQNEGSTFIIDDVLKGIGKVVNFIGDAIDSTIGKIVSLFS